MRTLRFLLLGCTLLAPWPEARADVLYALREDNTLLRFDSRAPGIVDATTPISGLAAGDALRGIDISPADHNLYGVAIDQATNSLLRLYRIDRDDGTAIAIGAPLPVSPAGAGVGIDFNPTVNRLRVINTGRANLRIDPTTGTIVDGDTNAGGTQQDTPLISGNTFTDCAYDRSFAGSTVTTLYTINYSTDQLMRIGGIDGSPSPNLGSVTVVGSLGIVQQNSRGAFDIVGPTPYLVATIAGVTNLYTVNKSSGAATLVGALAGNPAIRSLAGVDRTRRLRESAPGTFSIAGALPTGSRDRYGIAVPALSRLWAIADAGGARNDATASRDISLRLLATDFLTEIEQDRGDTANTGEDNTQEGAGAGIIAGRPLNVAGTHFLEVSEGFLVASNDDDPVSPYRLTAVITPTGGIDESEGNDTPATANPIGSEADVLVRTGTTSPVDIDWFALQLHAGDVVALLADGNPTRDPNAASEVDIELKLWSPSPASDILQSVFNRNTGTSPNEIAAGFVFYAIRSGTYFVSLEGSDSGDYALLAKTVRHVPTVAETADNNNSAGNAQALPDPGRARQLVGGAIGAAGDIDFYGFQADAGARVWAYVDSGGPVNQQIGTSRDSTLALSTNTGATVIETDDNDGTGNGGDDNDGGNGQASVIAGRALSGGSYQLRVGEAGDDQAMDPYRLFVRITRGAARAEREPDDTLAQAMAAGSAGSRVIDGEIDSVGDIDYYAIDAATDDIAWFVADGDTDRNGTGIDLKLRLLAPDGSTSLINGAAGIDSSGASPMPAEAFNFRFTLPGRYYLVVQERTDSGTGAYRLLIDGVAPFADGFE